MRFVDFSSRPARKDYAGGRIPAKNFREPSAAQSSCRQAVAKETTFNVTSRKSSTTSEEIEPFFENEREQFFVPSTRKKRSLRNKISTFRKFSLSGARGSNVWHCVSYHDEQWRRCEAAKGEKNKWRTA
ncbi:hypothetical protein NPIL_26871 [Nephila pilipes]|uniref:Uncharacterized protein n=1 Tax=Nephila pilipes TaxID=299642 RepID=A0A8X6QY00_NEPPI|nr:hypothetical protein NPIL_26871 [Nephila pilipes]